MSIAERPPILTGPGPSRSQFAAWLAQGRDALAEAASPLRLLGAIRDGRATPSQRRRVVGRLIDAGRARLSDLSRSFADRVRDRHETLAGWFRRFADLVAPQHYASVMAALSTLSPKPADARSADALVADQIKWLERFREDVRHGRQPLWASEASATPDGKIIRAASGSFLNRSGMYSDASWGIAEGVVREAMVRDGFTHCLRLLGAAETHCRSCVEEAAKGWTPIALSLPIGSGICRTRCRCSARYGHADMLDPVASPLGTAGRPA